MCISAYIHACYPGGGAGHGANTTVWSLDGMIEAVFKEPPLVMAGSKWRTRRRRILYTLRLINVIIN